MTEQSIHPERITKPIQLLGAWLAGLFSIDSCFLIAAANMAAGSWEAKALIIAAIFNVPLFLVAVFVLQTKFRPELQEDSFYSSYLSRKTNEVVNISKTDTHWAELLKRTADLEHRILLTAPAATTTASKLEGLGFGINTFLPDLEKLGEKLSERGVLAYSTFEGGTAPQGRIVAISKYLPKGTVKDIVALARDLEFDGYTMWDPSEEGNNDEDVLLGAYGDLEFRLTKTPPVRSA